MYFVDIFGRTTTLTQKTNVINLTTVPIEYMEIIVNFLYTNDAAAIQSQTFSDNFIYNMISICDQYFITRLRTVFEYILIDKLSIKRCGEMLELSCMYNCDTLKKVALDFIVQNSARILEMHALDTIDLIVLKKINEHYRKTFNCKIMEQRYDAPSDDVVESFVDDFVIDLAYKYTKKNKSTIEKSPKIPQTKRQYEKEAIGSIRNNLIFDESISYGGHRKSENISNSFVQEAEKISNELLTKSKQWTKVTTDKPAAKKSGVLAALKANEMLKNDTAQVVDKFVELKVTNKNQDQEFLSLSQKKNDIEDGNEYTNRPLISLASFTPQANRRRISQKQRKLSQNSSIEEPSINNTSTPTTPIPIPSSTHNNESVDNHSFADIMKSPDSFDNTIPVLGSNKISSLPKITETIVSPFSLKQMQNKKQSMGSSLPLGDSSFMKIQKNEKKERAYYEKLKTKSFVLTQIEETAIDELKKFYNIENVFDERIQIDRVLHEVQTNMNFAIWHQQQQQQQQKDRQLK